MKYVSLFLVFFLLLGYNKVFAQSDFLPGYLITSNQDTISGYLSDKTDAELASQVNFKTSLSSGEVKVYTVNDLKGFCFDNGRMFKRVPIMGKDTSFVFAKLVIRGKIDLLVWRRLHVTEPDMILMNNATNQTIHITKPTKSIRTGDDGKDYATESKRYVGLLNFIKGNAADNSHKALRYRESLILKDIVNYDKTFENEYPLHQYSERFTYTYDVFGGMPLVTDEYDGTFFRAGIYQNKTFPDKSRQISYFRGITFQYWSNPNRTWDASFKNGTANYRQIVFNVIPWGFKYQFRGNLVRPYAYLGVGAGVLVNSDYEIVDGQHVGNKTSYYPFPTIHVGAGLKVKVGANYIFTELTPLIYGSMLNVGFSF